MLMAFLLLLLVVAVDWLYARENQRVATATDQLACAPANTTGTTSSSSTSTHTTTTVAETQSIHRCAMIQQTLD
jgi:hypothetical protein